MAARHRRWFALGSGALVLGCAAAFVLLALALPPAQLRRARERWEQRRPRHYELVVLWNDSVGLLHHVRGEVRDGRVIAMTDLGSICERRAEMTANSAPTKNAFATRSTASQASPAQSFIGTHPLPSRPRRAASAWV